MDPNNNDHPNIIHFSQVEEISEAFQSLGWKIDYKQLAGGNFSVEFSALECEGVYLCSERVNNQLQVLSEPPPGFVGMFLPRFISDDARASGQSISDGDVVVFPSYSELEIITRNTIYNDTLFLAEDEFLAATRALVPGATLLTPKMAAIRSGNRKVLSAIQTQIDGLRRQGKMDIEAVSHLLEKIILWLADTGAEVTAEQLASRHRTVVVKRAQSFIHDHFRYPIRLQDLSTFAGVGLRTLQRYFAAYFQLSPQFYIKALRFNAARSALLAADPLTDTVTRIAFDSGFTHLGRFAVEYQIYFGESPVDTLNFPRSHKKSS